MTSSIASTLKYGAIGTVCGLGIGFVRSAFTKARETKQHAEEAAADRGARGAAARAPTKPTTLADGGAQRTAACGRTKPTTLAALPATPTPTNPSPSKASPSSLALAAVPTPYLEAEGTLYAALLALSAVRNHASGSFEELCRLAEKMAKVAAHARDGTHEAKLHWPMLAQRCNTKACDCLRVIRLKTCDVGGNARLVADEQLAVLQTEFDNLVYNVTMDTQHRFR